MFSAIPIVDLSIKMTLVTLFFGLLSKLVIRRSPEVAHRIWLTCGVSYFLFAISVFFNSPLISLPLWNGSITETNRSRAEAIEAPVNIADGSAEGTDGSGNNARPEADLAGQGASELFSGDTVEGRSSFSDSKTINKNSDQSELRVTGKQVPGTKDAGSIEGQLANNGSNDPAEDLHANDEFASQVVTESDGKGDGWFAETWDFGLLLGAVYCIGVFVVGFCRLIQAASAAAIFGDACPVDPEDIDWKALDVGLEKNPVWETDKISGPAVAHGLTGFWGPAVIFLPSGWRQWTADRLNCVLAHEQAHCKRKDLHWREFVNLGTMFFWFHPCAWFVKAQVERCAELACDLQAARKVGDPVMYAGQLVEVSKIASGYSKAGLLMPMASCSEISNRVDRLIEPDVLERKLGPVAWTSVLLSVLIVFCLVFVCSFVPKSPDRFSFDSSESAGVSNPWGVDSSYEKQRQKDVVAGEVVDTEGNGLDGVEVKALWKGGVLKTLTRGGGKFRFSIPDRFLPGVVILSRSAKGEMQGSFRFLTAKKDAFRQRPRIVHQKALIFTAKVVSEGSPVVEAWCGLLTGDLLVAEAMTDSEGLAVLRLPNSDMPPKLVVFRQGFAYQLVDFMHDPIVDWKTGRVRRKQAKIELTPGKIVKAKFVDAQGRAVEGVSVFPERLMGPFDNGFQNVAGLQDEEVRERFQRVSDRNGEVLLDYNFYQTTEEFHFESEGYGEGAFWETPAKPRIAKQRVIQVAPSGKVEFQVVDAEGEPIASQFVQVDLQQRLYSQGSERGSFYEHYKKRLFRTTKNGFVRFRADKFGYYYVSMVHPTLRFQEKVVVVEGKLKGKVGKTGKVIVGPGTVVDVTVKNIAKEPINRTVHVTHSANDSAPIRGFRFKYDPVSMALAEEHDDLDWKEVGSDGKTQLVLGPGEYSIGAPNADSKELEILPGQESRQLEVVRVEPKKATFEPKGRVIRCVDSQTGAPVSLGIIRICTEGGMETRRRLSEKGEVLWEDPVGTKPFRVHCLSQDRSKGAWKVFGADETDFVMKVEPAKSLVLQLYDSDAGKPLADATFDITSYFQLPGSKYWSSNFPRRCKTGTNGRLEIRGLLDGVEYSVEEIFYKNQPWTAPKFPRLPMKLASKEDVDSKRKKDVCRVDLRLVSSLASEKSNPKAMAILHFVSDKEINEAWNFFVKEIEKIPVDQRQNILFVVGDPADQLTHDYTELLGRNWYVPPKYERSQRTLRDAFYPFPLEVSRGKVAGSRIIMDRYGVQLKHNKGDVAFYVFEKGKLKTKRLWSEFWDSKNGVLDSKKWIQFLDQNGNAQHRQKRLVPIQRRLQQVCAKAKEQGKNVLAFYTHGATAGNSVLEKMLEETQPVLGRKHVLFQFDSWSAGDLNAVDPELSEIEKGDVWAGVFSPNGKLLEKKRFRSRQVSFVTGTSLLWFTELLRKVGVKIDEKEEESLKKIYKKIDEMSLLISSA